MNASAMKNDATMSQMVVFEKPASASLGVIVLVTIASASPMIATEPVGSGCRISPRIVATKIPSMCMPLASTPAGAGMK